MAEKSIKWSPTARKLFRNVLTYWNKRNGSTKYSEKLVQQVDQALTITSNFPETGIQSTHQGIRILVLGNYNIYYKNENSTLYVHLFWDNRQDSQDLVSELERINNGT